LSAQESAPGPAVSCPVAPVLLFDVLEFLFSSKLAPKLLDSSGKLVI
jgi:hypothetical protein